MLTTNEVAQVFDTILSSPGMNDAVKIDLRISRKNVLLLEQVISSGLNANEGDPALLLASLTEDDRNEIKAISEDCLQKAGLVELSEKLKTLGKAEKK